MSLEQIAERHLKKLERGGQKNDAYTIQLRKLLYHLSAQIRESPLMLIDMRQLASEIANPNIPIFQSRALQSFVGQIYSSLSRWHGPANRRHSSLTQRLSRLRARQEVPHPEILAINDADFQKMFDLIDAETVLWRSALALKLYFETGAKLRRVLRAQWDQVIDKNWCPYSPQERDYWFMGIERLSDDALRTIARAKQLAANEGIDSAFIFPSLQSGGNRPITTIRRYWLRLAKRLGWEELPLSHVVQRHNERNTPSYVYMYRYLFVPMRRAALDPALVSKMTNMMQK